MIQFTDKIQKYLRLPTKKMRMRSRDTTTGKTIRSHAKPPRARDQNQSHLSIQELSTTEHKNIKIITHLRQKFIPNVHIALQQCTRS